MNSKGFIHIAVLVMILVLGAVGGYLVVKEKRLFSRSESNQKQEIKKDEIVDWKIYTNSIYGFSFKYPPNWKIEDNLKLNTCCLNIFNSQNPYENDNLKTSVMKSQFYYVRNLPTTTKNQYINNLLNNQSEASPGPQDAKYVSVANDNDLEVLKFNAFVSNYYYVISRNSNFTEVIEIASWNTDPLFDKVLSTFKFTQPQTSQNIPSGWKAYTNTSYKYTIYHPQNVKVEVEGLEGSDVTKVSEVVVNFIKYPSPQTLNLNIAVKVPGGEGTETENLYRLSFDDFVKAIWKMNKDDRNPYITNKQVGEIITTTINGNTAYQFTLLGSYIHPGGGYVLDETHLYTYMSHKGLNYEIRFPVNDALAKQIVSTWRFE